MSFLLTKLNKLTNLTNYVTKRNMALVAVTVLAYQTYKGYKSYQKFMLYHKKQKELRDEQESAFENRYFKEYDQMKDDPDAAVPSANSHVRETTPQGDVIMTYDADRTLFCYYCDKRTVQFKYLEPVARKYVVEHGCKRLYIDFREEMAKAANAANAANSTNTKSKAINATNSTNTKPNAAASASAASASAASASAASASAANASATVFAQLKKYSTNPNTQSNNNNTLPKINELAKTKVSTNANNNNHALKEQVTHYLYCGRLDDFVDAAATSESSHAHDFSIIKPIDYASYKKISDGL